jgi:hypothetical protein
MHDMLYVDDSLSLMPTEVWDAARVYGPMSEPIARELSEAVVEQSSLVDNVWFQVISLVIVGLYLLMIYFFRQQVGVCLKSLLSIKTEERFSGEHGHLYNSFVVIAIVVGTLSFGVALTKSMATWATSATLATVSDWIVPMIAPILWGVAAMILIIQTTVLKAIGEFTFSSKMTRTITEIKSCHLAVAAILITPWVMLWSGVNPVWDTIVVWVIAIEGSVLLISFVFRTFLLFVGQKVSVLVWILYLCGVELFPIALICALLVTNF